MSTVLLFLCSRIIENQAKFTGQRHIEIGSHFEIYVSKYFSEDTSNLLQVVIFCSPHIKQLSFGMKSITIDSWTFYNSLLNFTMAYTEISNQKSPIVKNSSTDYF
jgi:hypothetical protein